MCVAFLALNEHPDYELIIAANRDEFYNRPTKGSSFWSSPFGLLAGKDLQSGGTWFGIDRTGKWSLVTNYRDPSMHREDAASRGKLVLDYFYAGITGDAYIRALATQRHQYNPFNLLVGDLAQACYLSGSNGQTKRMNQGIYGLSNAVLDTPWPKVIRGKYMMENALNTSSSGVRERLFEVLADDTKAADTELPSTGVDLKIERLVSSIFIASKSYGTRASTVLLIDKAAYVYWEERQFGENGKALKTAKYEFRLNGK
jgi:uncharacterized protein with NRDE domain